MDLFWLLIEASAALALLIAIVWWTWPRGDRSGKRSDKTSDEK